MYRVNKLQPVKQDPRVANSTKSATVLDFEIKNAIIAGRITIEGGSTPLFDAKQIQNIPL